MKKNISKTKSVSRKGNESTISTTTTLQWKPIPHENWIDRFFHWLLK